MATITIPRRTLIVIGSAIIALLLAIAILLAVLLTTISREQSEADYRRCLDHLGTSTVETGETPEEYVQRAAENAAFCSR